MSEDKTSVRVDIVSDVVCPWCAIGYYQLAAASRETGTDLDIRWHPFELNPQMAPEGENLREHLAAKYGTTPEGALLISLSRIRACRYVDLPSGSIVTQRCSDSAADFRSRKISMS